METKKYKTSSAFREALETRLNKIAKETNSDLGLIRRRVAFDRFLSRIFKSKDYQVVLKGGYSMALRVSNARATRDIDLAIHTKGLSKSKNLDHTLLEFLRKNTQKNLKDFFEFRVEPATMDLQAIPYGGKRFPVQAFMDNRLFVKFPVDIILTSMILDPIETLKTENWLSFAAINQEEFLAISKEQQFSEKLHAYTFPRSIQQNSRAKDLIDIVILIQEKKLNQKLLKTSIQKIFEYRNTHRVPKNLEAPPQAWESKFNKMAKDSSLNIEMSEAFKLLNDFFQQIFSKT